jgi:hypothetical protein
MDLQIYYRKIKDLEESIKDPSVVLVSRETPDGGRDGVRTEVPRRLAAKMIVDGSARLASEEEVRQFQDQKAEAKRKADQVAAASRMKFAVVSANELRSLRGSGRTAAE